MAQEESPLSSLAGSATAQNTENNTDPAEKKDTSTSEGNGAPSGSGTSDDGAKQSDDLSSQPVGSTDVRTVFGVVVGALAIGGLISAGINWAIQARILPNPFAPAKKAPAKKPAITPAKKAAVKKAPAKKSAVTPAKKAPTHPAPAKPSPKPAPAPRPAPAPVKKPAPRPAPARARRTFTTPTARMSGTVSATPSLLTMPVTLDGSIEMAMVLLARVARATKSIAA